MVFNLAQVNLSIAEKEILNKGLKYCPTPAKINPSSYEESIEQLHRKLLLQAYHIKQNNSSAPQATSADKAFQAKHKKPTTWIPPRNQCDQSLYDFANILNENLKKCTPRLSGKNNNLNNRQQRALRHLANRDDFILKAADKGSGVILLSPQQYELEAYKQLNDGITYKELDDSPLQEIQQSINDNITKHLTTGALSQKTANLLQVQNAKPGKFYLLPKIHKDLSKPPGRPIISANEHPTERISEYVDTFLKQHIPKIPSYLKDTNHFIETCKNLKLPDNATIVTLDVKGLYTNIPHDEGLIAIEEFMLQYHDAKTTKLLTQLTKLVLHNNIIEFNGKLYLQLVGCAMGSKMSPNYANVFMNYFECKFLPLAPVQPFLWKRFIDDVFAIFTCSAAEIKSFIEWINTVHPTIKFTADINPKGLPFLDTFVKIENNVIITRPYTKPTDRKQYIHPSSCHPPHIFKSIPYSQALRLKRICTKKEDLKVELDNLKGFFKNRGYPLMLIEHSFNKALCVNDDPRNNHQEEEDKRPTVMVIAYHPMNPGFSTCISQLWHKYEHILQDKIQKPIVAYTRPKNLKDILTRARYGPSAIKAPPFDPGKNVINRPLATYDKNQIKAPIKHVLFKCECDFIITDEFRTLQHALHSEQWRQYQAQHAQCAKLNILPVQVQHKIRIKCTECHFQHHISSTKVQNRTQDEIMHSVDTTQKALLRSEKTIRACSINCNACLMQNYKPRISDNRGCNYNYSTFDCKAKSVVYIIECQLCNMRYVGQTKGPIKTRLFAHLSNIRKFKNTSVACHFNSPDHLAVRDLKIGIIDSNIPSSVGLNIREATWIHHLDTIASGINRKDEARLFLDYQILAVTRHFRHSPTCLPMIFSKIHDISTLALQHFKRIPWVRTRTGHPQNDQRPAAALPNVTRTPDIRPALYPMFINSTTRQ